MKNLLVISDPHIKESEIDECNLVFDEIFEIKKQFNIDTFICAGDSFDRINPSPLEIDCFSSFLTKLNIPTILIAAKSHESISNTESILNHFGILNSSIQILPEYIDGNHLFIGHFILKESKNNYGATRSKNELKQFRYVILGHAHTYELIQPNCCQLGSIRFIDFAESSDKSKKILIITDYNEKEEKCHFIDLKTPYPMKDLVLQKKVAGTKDLKGKLGLFEAVFDLKSHLDQLSEKTKVRIIFKDYELWREFLPYWETYQNKFILFKDKKEFITQVINQAKNKQNISLFESLKTWLNENKIEEKIQAILIKELGE